MSFSEQANSSSCPSSHDAHGGRVLSRQHLSMGGTSTRSSSSSSSSSLCYEDGEPIIPRRYDSLSDAAPAAAASTSPFHRLDSLTNDAEDDDNGVEETTTTTPWQGFLHLVKGYVGPGCLSLPWAVSRLGIPMGILICWIMSAWSSYNCWIVVRLKRHMEQERGQEQHEQQQNQQHSIHDKNTNEDAPIHVTPSGSITYPDVSEWLCGRRMYQVTQWAICIQQMAICTVFVSFVGANLEAVAEAMLGVDVQHWHVMTLALMVILPLTSCCSDLKALAPVTALGTALLLMGLAVLSLVLVLEWNMHDDSKHSDDDSMTYFFVRNLVSEDNHNSKQTDFRTTLRNAPLAVCAILYSYEGICLVLPVETSLQGHGGRSRTQQPPASKNQKDEFGLVFLSAMIAAAFIFSLVAGLSVASLGRTIDNGSVTAYLLERYSHDKRNNDSKNNNEAHSPWVLQTLILLTNAFVSLSVLVTYPLQLYPAVELVEPCIASRLLFPSRFCSTSTTGSTRSTTEQQQVELTSALELGITSSSSAADAAADHVNTLAVEDEDEEDGLFQTNHSTAAAANGSAGTITRVILVLMTYFIAVIVPNVQSLISLAGALAGSSTALLIPPMLEIVWIQKQQQLQQQSHHEVSLRWYLILTYASLAGGFSFLCIGTAASSMDIVRAYIGGDP